MQSKATLGEILFSDFCFRSVLSQSLLCARFLLFPLLTVPIFRERKAQEETIVYHQGIYTFGSPKPGFLKSCLFFRIMMFRMKHMDVYVF